MNDPTRLCFYALAQPFDCSLNSAGAVRNPERTERHLYDTEGTEHHRGVVVTHVSNAEGVAVQLTKPTSKCDAALEIAVVVQTARITSVGEEQGCNRVGRPAGFWEIVREAFVAAFSEAVGNALVWPASGRGFVFISIAYRAD